MTFFQIADEYERDFEELELESLESCAHATLLFVQLGHLSARRMTDGRITQAMYRKRTVAWDPATLDRATSDLVRLGKVERTDDGGLQFLDWDLTQFTAEQERTRRARAAERQRRHRAAKQAAVHDVKPSHETIADSGFVTRDVTVPSASSSEEEREKREEKEPRPPPGVSPAPRSTRPRKARAEPRPETDKALLARVVREECAKGGQPPAAFTTRQVRDVVERGKFFADKLGTDLEGALRRMASGAVERHAETGQAIDWGIIRWSDAPAPEPRPLRYTGPKPCSPASDFAHVDIDEQIRQMRIQGRIMRGLDPIPRAAS